MDHRGHNGRRKVLILLMLNRRSLDGVLVTRLEVLFIVVLIVVAVAVDSDVVVWVRRRPVLCVHVRRHSRLALMLIELVMEAEVGAASLLAFWRAVGLLLHGNELIRLYATVTKRLGPFVLHTATSASTFTSRRAATRGKQRHFEFFADDARNLILFDCLDDSLDKLLLPMIELSSLRNEVLCLITSVALRKLLAEREYLLVQINQQALNRDAQPAFGACFDLLTFYHVPLQCCQTGNLISQVFLDSVEHREGVFRARVIIKPQLHVLIRRTSTVLAQ